MDASVDEKRPNRSGSGERMVSDYSRQYEGRLDFSIEVLAFDEESGVPTMAFVPDPHRYEWKESEGKRYLHDKFDNTYFTEKALLDLFNQLEGVSGYLEAPDIDNVNSYIESRRLPILRLLRGQAKTPTFEDKSQEFLRALALDKLGLVIMSVDMVESTRLAANMALPYYERLVSTLLFEMSEVIPRYRGHVLNYTGDGLIAYFPEPSFIRKNDLAIESALTLLRLVSDGLNPILKEQGFKPIAVRIGVDAGPAAIVTLGSPVTKQQRDIIGRVVSLAAKIQGLAQPGGICLGDTVARNLHTSWRQLCRPVELPTEWPYQDSDGNPYQVHRLNSQQQESNSPSLS